MGFWKWLTATEELPVEQRATWSISDPALAEFLGLSTSTLAGISVTEHSALGLTAVYRAVSLVAGTIASLPLKSYRTSATDVRERVPSFLDNPAGPDSLSPYEWKELVVVHLLLHGNAYLLHLYNGAGSIVGLQPLHPSVVSIQEESMVPGGKVFRVLLTNGENRELTSQDLTHIPALGTDGLRGLSPIQMARNAIGTGLAGERAAARMFSNGLLLGGIVSAEGVNEEQAQTIKEGLRRRLVGSDNAGDIAVVNAALSFSPWTMNAEDAQFIESRAHQIEEVARIFGVPKVLLAQDGASTWGSGIAELIRGMARFTLMPWTTRLEERLSRLLSRPTICEFDYAGWLQPAPAEEIGLLIQQLEAGVLTLDEVRRIRNLPPLEAPAPAEENDAV